MFRLVPVLIAFFLAVFAFAQEPTKIKPGDTLTVITSNQAQYSGDFVVSSDGSIVIPVFGRFIAQDKTVTILQKDIQKVAREYVRDAQVSVVLKLELAQFVYLVSEKVSDGSIPWVPGMTVRQLIAKHPNLDSLDTYTASLYSRGAKTRKLDVVKLIRAGDESENFALSPGDVLTLLPSAAKMVWVTGSVNRPGQVRLNEDDGASQAIALCNGINTTNFSSVQITVSLRRGEQSYTKKLSEIDADPRWKLEPGDTISVQLPKQIKVTAGGFVKRPGEISLRDDSPIVSAIEGAGGTTDAGTLERVLLFRKGEITVVDLRTITGKDSDGGGVLQDGDFVYVSENKRTYHVFGYVNVPGVKIMPDSHLMHMSDALAAGMGLAPKGTYRHAVLLRPGANGKYVPMRYDFDKFIKNGDASQNPEIAPGDLIFFDQTSGTILDDILRVLPSIVLIQRLF